MGSRVRLDEVCLPEKPQERGRSCRAAPLQRRLSHLHPALRQCLRTPSPTKAWRCLEGGDTDATEKMSVQVPSWAGAMYPLGTRHGTGTCTDDF